MIEIDYKKATELDPLGIDADLFHLPEYNERADILMILPLGLGLKSRKKNTINP